MQRVASVSRVSCAVGFVALALAVVGGQQAVPQAAPVFTAAQAQAGGAVYAQSCSACHGANFEGSGDAPSLAGGTFRLKWGPKMVSELFGLILQTMPRPTPDRSAKRQRSTPPHTSCSAMAGSPARRLLTPAPQR